jgi:hypothetical protein
MYLVRRLVGALDGLIDRLLCVLGAVVFSQAPEFMQQYWQRLGGHLDEARLHLDNFRHAADASGQTLEQFISHTTASTEPSVAQLGGVISDVAARVEALQKAHDALAHATLWQRPVVFVRNFDFGIAHATWKSFKPAIPTTVEGLVYAVAGILMFLALYHFGFKPFIRGTFGSKEKPAEPALKPA